MAGASGRRSSCGGRRFLQARSMRQPHGIPLPAGRKNRFYNKEKRTAFLHLACKAAPGENRCRQASCACTQQHRDGAVCNGYACRGSLSGCSAQQGKQKGCGDQNGNQLSNHFGILLVLLPALYMRKTGRLSGKNAKIPPESKKARFSITKLLRAKYDGKMQGKKDEFRKDGKNGLFCKNMHVFAAKTQGFANLTAENVDNGGITWFNIVGLLV